MSNKITKGITKKLILEILQTVDEVDIKTGRPMVRTSIPKNNYRGYVELQEKIIYTIEVGIGIPAQGVPADDPKAEVVAPELEWVTFTKNFKAPDGKRIMGERHTDAPVEISEAAVKALRYFYSTRDELPIYPMEAIDELENLIKC